MLSDSLSLISVSEKDQVDVLTLMQTIYPPVYEHLWEDGGLAYLKRIYGKPNFLRELMVENTHYFRVYVQEIPGGILRVLVDKECPDFPDRSAMKLQRIFLHPEIHGKGIGKKLMDWVVSQAIQEGKELLWLECMDSQQQALGFYEKMGFQKGGASEFLSDKMKRECRGMLRMWREVPSVST